MTLLELRTVFRRETRDVATTQLWSDLELNEFANDAQVEAVRRAKLIIDSTTAAICEIPYVVGSPVLDLDARVIQIREAIVGGETVPLYPTHLAEMPVGWRSTSASTPREYVDDWGTNQIRLYPTPVADGTLLLSVFREPLEVMTANDHEPEIQARYHRALVQWMLHRAYSKMDTQTLDQQKAAKAEKAFIAEFGPRVSARSERWVAEMGSGFPNALA